MPPLSILKASHLWWGAILGEKQVKPLHSSFQRFYTRGRLRAGGGLADVKGNIESTGVQGGNGIT